jgi:diacylglycerol kinase (ATP)
MMGAHDSEVIANNSLGNLMKIGIIEFIESRTRSFRYAFSGWWYVLRTQRNAWIHATASFLVILLSSWLQIDRYEWAVILLAISIVWTAEFLNTALEAVVDLASQHEYNHLAKRGKDVGAAAVLIAASASAMIGLLILGPPLWERIQQYFGT